MMMMVVLVVVTVRVHCILLLFLCFSLLDSFYGSLTDDGMLHDLCLYVVYECCYL